MNADAVNATLQTIAAHGLPGAKPDFPDAPLDDETWAAVEEGVRWHRIAVLFARAILDGSLPTTPGQATRAMTMERATLTAVLALEASLVSMTALLERTGSRFRVLKGSAVAHLDYPDPALREFGDVDLLIHPDDLPGAIAALTERGYVRRFPEPRPGFDRRFTKSVSLTGPAGEEVDLHRSLATGGFGHRIVVEMLWSDAPASFHLAGRALPALGAEQRFLHACYHMVLGNAPPRLVPQRDLAQMLLTGALSEDRVRLLASAWRGEAVVAHAIATAWRTLRLTEHVPLSLWATQYQPRQREERELARAISPNYTYAAQAFDAVRAIRGARNRLAYVTAMAFPRRSYLGARHSGILARVRHGLAEVVHTRTITKENR